METLGWLGATVVFLVLGLVLVMYENIRNKAGRPILKGGTAAQSYYIIYFAMFVMALTTGIKAIVGQRPMFHITAGLLMLAVGVAMILFARPKNNETTWVYRFQFIGDLYVVAAVSFVVLGLCIAALG